MRRRCEGDEGDGEGDVKEMRRFAGGISKRRLRNLAVQKITTPFVPEKKTTALPLTPLGSSSKR